MATINNKLIHFKSKSDFNSRYEETTDGGNTYGDFLGTSIVFIQDAKQIWTHGQFYDANEVTLTSLGITATSAEINKLDGLTATTTELNYVDGVTSNIQTQLNGKAATSHNHNASNINAGTLDIARIPTGTSATTVALGNHTHGTNNITALTGYTEGSSTTALSSSMSLNTALASLQNQIQAKIDSLSDLGVTATAAELNKLDGCTATVTELNYVDGVTSNIQTQLNGKQATITGGASTIVTNNLTASRALISDASGKVAISSVTSTELGYLDGVTSSIQTQLNNKVSLVDGVLTLNGNSSTGNAIDLSSDEVQNLNIISNNQNNIIIKTNNTSLEITPSGINLSGDNAKYNDAVILTEDNYDQYISSTDTKNTTGTANSTSKLYLAGGTSQNSAGVITFSNNAVFTMAGQLFATQMNAANGFYETSDARLKNFKDDIKALDVVSEIPTKYFTWKEDENQESQIGTSAQEVEKLYPELVSKTEDDTLTVDYAKLSIIALAAIKELKAEIQSLKEEVKQLKLK